MKKDVGCIALLAVHTAALWAAAAETSVAGTPSQLDPIIALSPIGLDFGLVGVGRTKELVVTVKNAGGGVLTGKARVPAPFNVVAGERYSLAGGQSQLIRMQYQPTTEGTNAAFLVFSGGQAAQATVTGFARTPPAPPQNLGIISSALSSAPAPVARPRKFAEEQAADFIVRYYSDEVSYVLKPLMMDGQYRSVCDRPLLLRLAARQPGRELAVIVLVHYPGADAEADTKLAWVNDLTRLGYRRIVFLRSRNDMKVDGLILLETPRASTISAAK